MRSINTLRHNGISRLRHSRIQAGQAKSQMITPQFLQQGQVLGSIWTFSSWISKRPEFKKFSLNEWEPIWTQAQNATAEEAQLSEFFADVKMFTAHRELLKIRREVIAQFVKNGRANQKCSGTTGQTTSRSVSNNLFVALYHFERSFATIRCNRNILRSSNCNTFKAYIFNRRWQLQLKWCIFKGF